MDHLVENRASGECRGPAGGSRPQHACVDQHSDHKPGVEVQALQEQPGDAPRDRAGISSEEFPNSAMPATASKTAVSPAIALPSL